MKLYNNISSQALQSILQKGTKKIAPLWSLENFVAVNPYLGMADKRFEDAMTLLHKSAQIKSTLPLSFYLQTLESGRLKKTHIEKALKQNILGVTEDADSLIENLYKAQKSTDNTPHIRTLIDLVSKIEEKDWTRFMVDRVSFWASAYFDNKQALWQTNKFNGSIFSSWKQEAAIDYSTEAMGLKGIRSIFKSYPNNYEEAARRALSRLNIAEEVQELYLTALLMKVNGWAGIASRMDWDAQLAGQESNATAEFLTVLLVWEASLLELINSRKLELHWQKNLYEASENIEVIEESVAELMVLQKAFDIANQDALIDKINGQKSVLRKNKQAKVQAIFCIDVRSELYRRHLEAANSEISTMGFAGFFAFPIKYRPLGHDEGMDQCPVLLTTSHTIHETTGNKIEDQKQIERRSFSQQVKKAWKSFKLGAITCFSFVGPVGLAYLPKLFTDSFGLTRPVTHPDKSGLGKSAHHSNSVSLQAESNANLVAGITVEERIEMAMTALKAMSLTEDFARIVMITGHGSSTLNNPHATGLDCGACGGHTGEANAKVAAAVLNDAEVRKALYEKGINIPESTLFVASLHDTTTDEVHLYEPIDGWPSTHKEDLNELKLSLALAGEGARKERASRMGIKEGNQSKQVLARSKDWSQVRPEWGLAGCSSFIVAPRERTEQLEFGGKAFMHSYDWQKDENFGVLELIMTAPMVVTSWINLQYYASTVDNEKFGSGNKTLHNVVGGLGVLEGFSGDLRTGLPWQSIHDGKKFQHEPQRLNVFIEAPVDEMSKILAKHEGVKHLVDNEWIYLFAIDREGKVKFKYKGDLEWEVIN